MTPFCKLEKHTWKSARKLVQTAYPELACVIDEISPGDKFTLYVANYPYGAMIVDRKVFLVPNADGHVVPLYHPTIPEDYKKDLDFGGAIPMGLVTKNKIESFIEYGERIVPFTIFGPGDVLALWRIFDKEPSYQAPFWRISSGSRAICMLPKIADKNGYTLLKKKYNTPTSIPQNLLDHWHLFVHIANHSAFSQPWSSEIIYFSKEWFSKKNDPQWSSFYYLLLDKVWQESAFARNQMFFNYFFSAIQEIKNLKSNPYLADTALHLIAMCNGEAPGFIPAIDSTAAPIMGLQKTFKEDYRLKKYAPVIMHMHHFSLDKKVPVYYSFEMPTTKQFSPRSNKALTKIAEIRELKHITEVLLKEIKTGNTGIEKTPLFDLVKKIEISFYHNEKDNMGEILPASHLATLNKSFVNNLVDNDQYIFPEFAPFFRGCICIANK